jgi:hypothetical protein
MSRQRLGDAARPAGDDRLGWSKRLVLPAVRQAEVRLLAGLGRAGVRCGSTGEGSVIRTGSGSDARAGAGVVSAPVSGRDGGVTAGGAGAWPGSAGRRPVK